MRTKTSLGSSAPISRATAIIASRTMTSELMRRPSMSKTTALTGRGKRMRARLRRVGPARNSNRVSVGYEPVGGVALEVEERGEVGVIDAGVGPGRHDRLGAVGDAEAGGLEHGEVVGAVADGERVGEIDAGQGGFLDQRGELCVAAEDGLGDEAGERTVGLEQAVGALGVEAGRLGHAAG